MERVRPILRRLALAALGVVGVLSVVLAAAYGFLQTEAGRHAAVPLIEKGLAAAGVEARVDGLTELSAGRLRLARLSLLDGGAPWLDIDGIDLAWRPSALLKGRVRIDSLAVSRAMLLRLPPSSGGSAVTADDLRLPVGVAVEKLSIGTLAIDPRILGQDVALGIEGQAAVHDDGTGSLRLDVQRRDAGGGRLAAHADYALASRKLDLGLSLSEPEGGLLVTLLDVPGRPAVIASLDGAGSLDGWHGRFTGSAGGTLSAEAGIDLAFDRHLTVDLSGKANVGEVLPLTLRGLAGPEVAIDAKAAWDPATDDIHLSSARLASGTATVAIDGTLNGRSHAVDGRVTASLPDGERLAPLIGPGAVRSATATVTLGGPLPRPHGRIEARLDGLSYEGMAAGQATLAGTYAFSGDGPVATEGSLRLAGLGGLPAGLDTLLGDAARAEWKGRVFANGDVGIASAHISAKGASTTLSGTVAADGNADLAGSAEVPDLAMLEGLFAMPVRGGASVTTSLHVAGGRLRATVAADLRNLSLPDAGSLAGVLGSEITLVGDVEGGAGAGWRVDNITLDGKGLAASGRFALAPDLKRFDADYRVRLADLAGLTGPLALAVGGEAVVSGTAKGTLAVPRIKGSLTSSALRVAGDTWRDVSVDYTIDDVAARPKGTVSGQARSPWDAVSLRGDFAMKPDGRLALGGLDLKALESRVSGAVSVDMGKGLLDGHLALTAADLRPWSPVLGMPMAGEVSTKLTLESVKGRQEAVVDFDGRRLVVAPAGEGSVAVGAGHLSAKAALSDLFAHPQLDGRGRATGLARDNLRLASLDARLRGGLDRMAFDLSATGAKETPLDIATSGNVAVKGDAFDLTVAKLAGTVYGQPVALTGPVTVRRGAGRTAVQGLSLRIGDGQVEGDASLSGDKVALEARLRHLSLALVNLVWPDHPLGGIADGEVRLSGTPLAPAGTVRLSTTGATVGVTGENLALRGWAEGTLSQGELALKAGIEGPGKASVAFEGRLPLWISADPPALHLAADGALAATVHGGGNLTALLGPLIPDPHRLSGEMNLNVTVSGTVSAPRAAGFVKVAGGRYENIVTGMLVRDIALEARIHDTSLDITQAGGLAGNGRIDASGRVGLDPAAGFPVDLTVRADKAGVAGRDDVAVTASGVVTLKGPATAPAIAGKVTVDEAEVRLIDRLPPDVVKLDVVEIHGKQTKAEASEAAGPAARPITLDLTIAVPARLFVRGRGLDSEWNGSIHIVGSLETPSITGQLSPVRGQFAFAGKTFTLKQNSSVAFRDPTSLIPVLDITAESAGQDFTARFTISGPADDPKLILSSSPELPQDEIISRLLFGRGVARISALEAAQLAEAAASLSGRGGLGVLDTARRLLGVDVLRVEAGDKGGGPAVTAGRYIGKDVYVGVSQGTSAKSGEAKVEVELTPHITIETEVGPTSGGQLGARWKYDY